MKFAIPTRQLARVYVDAQILSLNVEQLVQLSQEMGLPQQWDTPAVLPLPVADSNTLANQPMRFALTSPQLDWQLSFLPQSFDLTHLPTDIAGSNMRNFQDFASVAAPILWGCTHKLGRVPHRLALVQTGMLDEMPTEKLNTISQRLLRLPSSFQTQLPFEWDWRCARHGTVTIGDRNEEVNILTTIKRQSGLMQLGAERVPFDRIIVELDVNTSPKDTRGRFYIKEDVEQFFQAAIEQHSQLAVELTAFAFEGSS